MGKKEKKKEKKTNYDTARDGISLFNNNHLFGNLYRFYIKLDDKTRDNQLACTVSSNNEILLNMAYKNLLTEQEWFYLIVHQYLHLAFGHFDANKISGKNKSLEDSGVSFHEKNWKLACELYNTKFLLDLKLGKCPFSTVGFEIRNQSEIEIYEILMEMEWNEAQSEQAEQIHRILKMEGLKHPLVHKTGNPVAEEFATKLVYTAKRILQNVTNEEKIECSNKVKEASEWFIGHYPLLGGLAAGFHIVEDYRVCQNKEIQIAAVDIAESIIYINPAVNLSVGELKFVLAHEYLHAGLMHHERCQGRNHYLWNIACDYVINGWQMELQIGEMPQGILYDEEYKNLSAEIIYDLLLQDMRKSLKLMTLRGYGKGDVINDSISNRNIVDIEDFYKNALKQGLTYHENENRGYLPEGLIQEIRALGMPPISWDVELAKWFEDMFPLEERHYSYARPSRRQSSSPDIPRPRLTERVDNKNTRIFGVVIDTSGSMSEKLLAMALGTISSYATSREVKLVRVVFCDAMAYDAGYLSPDELAGCVEIKGRGGTILQPGIDCLEKAKDFPKDGPILIITDGFIENNLKVKREHAFLLPKGRQLPFPSKGNMFYINEK